MKTTIMTSDTVLDTAIEFLNAVSENASAAHIADKKRTRNFATMRACEAELAAHFGIDPEVMQLTLLCAIPQTRATCRTLATLHGDILSNPKPYREHYADTAVQLAMYARRLRRQVAA